jgi:uncharacterized protein (TIGR00255 family)
MTGYGSADGELLGGRLRVDIRTVNHRYFNPQLKLPHELATIESELRERLRQLLERGHVAVTARWLEVPAVEQEIEIDVARARQLLAAFKKLKKQLKLKGELDLAFVARQADVLVVRNGSGERADPPVSWDGVRPIVERAAQEVLAMREREGAALATELLGRLDTLERHAQVIEGRVPVRLAAEVERLQQAVAELVQGATIDPQRVALEVALMADRMDITEELVRFRTHLAACRGALRGEGATGGVGKQLGFLSQELLREINTMGSKANDAVITQSVIAMKGDLERFREQLENLE